MPACTAAPAVHLRQQESFSFTKPVYGVQWMSTETLTNTSQTSSLIYNLFLCLYCFILHRAAAAPC